MRVGQALFVRNTRTSYSPCKTSTSLPISGRLVFEVVLSEAVIAYISQRLAEKRGSEHFGDGKGLGSLNG